MKNLLLVLCLLFVSTFSSAQLEPVKWTIKTEKISDTEYDIHFVAKIENGWSVYSQHMNEGGPVPTSFNFQQTNVEPIGDAREIGRKKESFDEVFGMTLTKFSGRAKFTQRVKTDGKSNAIKGYVTYMTCDDNSCLPPENHDFVINLD